MTKLSYSKIKILKAYLWILGILVLFWWPLSHWFYPEWYHRLMGFKDFDSSLVTIIGTTGVVVVMNIFMAAIDPIRNRGMLAILITFSIAMAGTYCFLIQTQGFPSREYFNMALLMLNTVILTALFPRDDFAPVQTLSRSC
ncbi:MAG: hypothetical protein HY912_04155 [Desulfomonile tiedjei]|uniref:Uncharacterized protein n=1 Tax=Desulfomonile tiedjei TaxID=2358 RepID=A0A9D6V0Z1_9BACT|nr:hypothetical protein [Desulfomonile tiedjei]